MNGGGGVPKYVKEKTVGAGRWIVWKGKDTSEDLLGGVLRNCKEEKIMFDG